jgi:subtilisin
MGLAQGQSTGQSRGPSIGQPIGRKISVQRLSVGEARALKSKGLKVEKNRHLRLLDWGTKTAEPTSTVIWPFRMIRADEAHRLPYGRGEGVRVCVIDTGVDLNHPALRGTVIEGRNFSDPEHPDDLSDPLGHGTAIASLLVGQGQRDYIGVAPEARVIVAKAMGQDGSSTQAQIIEAFRYCAMRSDIIQMAFGGGPPSDIFSELMKEARAQGVTMIAAAGNTGSEGLMYPASDPSVMAVGAVDENGSVPEFSARDSRLAYVAPGVEVPILAADGKIVRLSGTSMSAALVSGIEAIRRSRRADAIVARDLGLPLEVQGLGLADAFLTATSAGYRLP